MIRTLVTYKVKQPEIATIVAAIQEFIAAIQREEPGAVYYEVFQVNGGPDFIHVMTFRNEDAETAHRESDHVSKFVAVLYPRCEVRPKFSSIDSIAAIER
ncbi:MAG: antibiotic biosynthesis monooxygenase [candidate division Zixibacteria bacterium]|nr:antibiotic biosynthesis monooxygenase [candidate division Zixibacteria bacterium]